MSDSVYYQRCLCEKCYNIKCSMNGQRVVWKKGHTCSSFVGEDPPDEDTGEYESPDYSNVFPPGTWGKWVV